MQFSQLPREVTDEILAYAILWSTTETGRATPPCQQLVPPQQRSKSTDEIVEVVAKDVLEVMHAQFLLDSYSNTHRISGPRHMQPFNIPYPTYRAPMKTSTRHGRATISVEKNEVAYDRLKS
ncbi:hypothetical protein DPSP01_008052 [Paraphaeosphaeria sporulosa]